MTLLDWLITQMPRSRAKKALASGRVHVNGVSTTRHDAVITTSDRVTFADAPRKQELTILYEDEHIVAIDKPAGLLSVASNNEKLDTAFVKLTEQLGQRIFVVHRLDRETSGVLLFAKSINIVERLQAGWTGVIKNYRAGVDATPDWPCNTPLEISTWLRENANLRVQSYDQELPRTRQARTTIWIIRPGLLNVRIHTGHKHQIRVHLASIGCPIIGDELYGGREAKRLMLHAHQLRFEHPVTSQCVEITSPPPPELS